MNILEFEEYLLKKDYLEDEFSRNLEENFSEKLELVYPNKNRKLTEEEIIFEYFDESLAELFEGLLEENISEEDKLERRVITNTKLVYRLALYLIRDGIRYDDLTQDGILGLIKAANLYEDDNKFEIYKSYYIIKEMFEHIKKYVEYRKLAFKKYIEEKKAEKIELSLKVEDKFKKAEMKKLQEKNKLKNKDEMDKLETVLKNTFDYFNLKYRLSLREIEALVLYFGLDKAGKIQRKNFTDIEKIMKISSEDVDKLLRESLFKLSVTDEKVEL